MNKIKKPTISQDAFVLGFFIIGFLLLISFFYYNATKGYVKIVDEIEPLFNEYEREISSDMIPIPNGLKVSYIFWLYFENNSENSNWFSNFTDDKTILDKDFGPNVVYNPYNNSLKVLVKVKDVRRPIVIKEGDEEEANSVYEEQNNSSLEFKEKVQEVELTGIPLQKWIQIVVVLDGRYIDIYLDTVLKKSALLDNIPILNHKNITIGKSRHNPNCFLGQLEYKPDLVTLSEINGLYFRDANSFTIESSIKKKVETDTFNIKREDYKKRVQEEENERMNTEDPI